MIGLVKNPGGTPLYQLKITLNYSRPSIWRRIVVPSNLRLNRLHDVIQQVMPWTNCHMHHFIVGKPYSRDCIYYGRPNPQFADMDSENLNEAKYTIADIAPAAKAKFYYEYDFGDGWEHQIVVEKVLPPDAGFKRVVCLAGKNACPPDDCGGIPGYYQMLEIIADPKHPDHEHMKLWLGVEWDAARFDLEEVNGALKRVKV
ncbi:MAG: plasmid pRiA4b ORF-3 family protein [Verrucomicrobiota bacterium]